MARLLREPLAHFLLAGAAIWGVLSVSGEPVDPADRTITLTREQQAGLALGFERTMGRAPTDAELDAQITRWLREEVLYREALRLGLDQGDPVVRRRLASKMDELAGAEAELAEPSDAQLAEWFEEQGSRFARGGVLTFEQAYFQSEKDARTALESGQIKGDAISLPASVTAAREDRIARIFGADFAQSLKRLPAGSAWQGPLRSGYGWHLVRLVTREDAVIPPLADIRERAILEWRNSTARERREEAFTLLEKAYTIEVE